MHLTISSQEPYEVGKAAVIMLITLNIRKPDLQVVIDLPTTTQDGEILILSVTGVSELLTHCLPFTHSAMWCYLLDVSLNLKPYKIMGILCFRLSDGRME